MSRNTMTVGELRALLEGVDPDLPVWTEGCDCEGEACSVQVDVEGGEVTILRSFAGEAPPRLQAEAEEARAEVERRRQAYQDSLPSEDPFK